MKWNNRTRRLVMVLAVPWYLIVSACDQSVTSILAALTTAAATFKQDKLLVESFVQDIKRANDPAEPAYQIAQKEYLVARAMHERYLDAISLAAIAGSTGEDIEQIAVQSRSASAEFLLSATKSLAPRAVTSKIPFSDLTHTPTDLSVLIGKLPRKSRQQALDILSEVRWRTWDELR